MLGGLGGGEVRCPRKHLTEFCAGKCKWIARPLPEMHIGGCNLRRGPGVSFIFFFFLEPPDRSEEEGRGWGPMGFFARRPILNYFSKVFSAFCEHIMTLGEVRSEIEES